MTTAPDNTPFATQVPFVVSRVAAVFGVEPGQVRGPRRWRSVVPARFVAMGILSCSGPRRGGSPWSLPEIGRQFGGRDHTTVLNAVRRYRAWCDQLGLDAATADPAGRAAEIARHLGMPPQSTGCCRDIDGTASPAVTARAPATPSPGDLAPPTMPLPSSLPTETPMLDLQRFVPEPIWTGSDFGDFQMTLADFEALPPAMQAEGLALAIEKAGAEDSRSRAEVGRRLGLSAARTDALLRLSPLPHDLPREDAICRRYAAEGEAPRAVGSDAPLPSSEPGFRRFAESCLVLDAAARLDKRAAFSAYLAFCREHRLDALERSNFGFELKRLAGGTKWQGDVQPGIALRAGAGR
ncbi:hypothetical protein Sa4125_25300 [Aureimonas sp. SA4125]|nr:hypothetical protein Sa4125_25300 [Aureimonas sp. SA4125]